MQAQQRQAPAATGGLSVTTSPETEKAIKFMSEPTCQRCIHFGVCKFASVLMKTVQQFLLPNEKGEPDLESIPFKFWDWSKICKAYAAIEDPSKLRELR